MLLQPAWSVCTNAPQIKHCGHQKLCTGHCRLAEKKGLSINAASRRFDIPRTTLQRHLKGKVSGDCKLGRFRQVFSSELGGWTSKTHYSDAREVLRNNSQLMLANWFLILLNSSMWTTHLMPVNKWLEKTDWMGFWRDILHYPLENWKPQALAVLSAFTYPLSCGTWHFQNVVPILCHVLHDICLSMPFPILCHAIHDKYRSVTTCYLLKL